MNWKSVFDIYFLRAKKLVPLRPNQGEYLVLCDFPVFCSLHFELQICPLFAYFCNLLCWQRLQNWPYLCIQQSYSEKVNGILFVDNQVIKWDPIYWILPTVVTMRVFQRQMVLVFSHRESNCKLIIVWWLKKGVLSCTRPSTEWRCYFAKVLQSYLQHFGNTSR